MTQSIASWRPAAWPPPDSPDASGPPPPMPRPIAIREPPDLPDVDAAWSPVIAPNPSPSSRIDGPSAVASRATADAVTRARLDAFKAAMSGPYKTRDGEFWAPTPFRMSTGYASQAQSMALYATTIAVAARSAHLSPGALQDIRAGRGTPGDIRRFAQALIDEQGRPPDGGPWTEEKIQKLMFDCGVGIDCAGYVQQAYLSATQLSRSGAGFARILDEALFNLRHRGFQRVSSPAQLRPGDLVVFGPPNRDEPGHRVIVYDAQPATADDLRRLMGSTNPLAMDFASGGPILKVLADSSWGGYGDPRFGGVQRQTWWYNESTKVWGYMDLRPHYDAETGKTQLGYEFRVGSRPSDDPLEGFYRRGAP